MQIGIVKEKSLPDVPLMLDLAKDEKTRQMYALLASASAVGRSIFAPPGAAGGPREGTARRVRQDGRRQAFLAEAKKRDLVVNPTGGAQLQEVVAKTLATPKAWWTSCAKFWECERRSTDPRTRSR